MTYARGLLYFLRYWFCFCFLRLFHSPRLYSPLHYPKGARWMKVMTAVTLIGAAGSITQTSFIVMAFVQVVVLKMSRRFQAAAQSVGRLRGKSAILKSCWLIQAQAGLAQQPFKPVHHRIRFIWALAAQRQGSIVLRFPFLRAVLHGRFPLRVGWCIFVR